MLLDSWTIPSVIFLTWMFLKTQYTFRKFLGVGICLAVTVIFSVVHASDRRESGSSSVKGDLLVICGSMLYAVSNVSQNSGSTMFNLSLLTSDMWAVLIRVFAYHEKVDWLYFIAFGAVSVGLVVYSVRDQGPQIANQVATDSIINCHDRNEAARLVNNTINKSAHGVSRVGDAKDSSNDLPVDGTTESS